MYNSIFVGGTFDRIHKGHERILTSAFESAKIVVIGITTDLYVRTHKTHAHDVRPFAQRREELDHWLLTHEYFDRSRIEPIDDPYEPASSNNYDAIIVTSDNHKRGEEINKRRKERTLPELVIVEVPLLAAADGLPISSTRIRSGEIDTQGQLSLPDHLRPVLAKPLGKLLSGEAITKTIEELKAASVITVGDVTARTFVEAGCLPGLMIIDLQVKRVPFDTLKVFPESFHPAVMRARSGPGHVSIEAINAIRQWSNRRAQTILIIEGEEDLLALPAIVYAPAGSYVCYGQPDEGLVVVEVTEAKKEEVKAMLEEFT